MILTSLICNIFGMGGNSETVILFTIPSFFQACICWQNTFFIWLMHYIIQTFAHKIVCTSTKRFFFRKRRQAYRISKQRKCENRKFHAHALLGMAKIKQKSRYFVDAVSQLPSKLVKCYRQRPSTPKGTEFNYLQTQVSHEPSVLLSLFHFQKGIWMIF